MKAALPLCLCVFVAACGGSATSPSNDKYSSTPSPAPPGCSGSPIRKVGFKFGPDGAPPPGQPNVTSGTAQFQGETITLSNAGYPPFVFTRDIVPCEYEITGQSTSREFSIHFARTAPFEGGGGVESASIVALDVPAGVELLTQTCQIGWNATGNAMNRVQNYPIRVRFRVSSGGDCR